jgi:nicotinate-nucleotide--dimethylbenzimidazole phosphoribosyltransferase
MQIDDFLELVHTRRSARKFKPDAIPAADIDKMIEAARWAMSGANAQPWEFVVVDDKAMRERIVGSWLEPRKEVYAIEQTRVPELRHPNFRDLEISPGFRDAPVFIIVLGDRRTYQATVLAGNYLWGEGGTDATYLKNVGNATQNLHMAAAALGLGAQWVSVNRIWGQAIKEILGIPDMLDVHTLVAVGHPAYKPKPGIRRPLDAILHRNAYDMRKYRNAEDIQRWLRELRQNTAPSYDRYSRS